MAGSQTPRYTMILENLTVNDMDIIRLALSQYRSPYHRVYKRIYKSAHKQAAIAFRQYGQWIRGR